MPTATLLYNKQIPNGYGYKFHIRTRVPTKWMKYASREQTNNCKKLNTLQAQRNTAREREREWKSRYEHISFCRCYHHTEQILSMMTLDDENGLQSRQWHDMAENVVRSVHLYECIRLCIPMFKCPLARQFTHPFNRYRNCSWDTTMSLWIGRRWQQDITMDVGY